jgi:hypothetical protein
MPTPRKSAKLLTIGGAYEANPKRSRRDIEAKGDIGRWAAAPRTDPAAVWAELVAQAPPGLLTSADRAAMEVAVRLVVELRTDPNKFSAARGSLLISLLGKLGCLPAARVSMALPPPKHPGSDFQF